MEHSQAYNNWLARHSEEQLFDRRLTPHDKAFLALVGIKVDDEGIDPKPVDPIRGGREQNSDLDQRLR